MAAVIASLLATLQVLLSAVGSNVRLERAEPAATPLGVAIGDTRCADWRLTDGEWRCPENVWLIRVSPSMDFSAMSATGAGEAQQQRQTLALATLVHELAHVYDGMDDGRLNGSPGHPRPDDFMRSLTLTNGRQPWEPSPWYCWAANADTGGSLDAPATDEARAEWYACEVTRTGRLR